MTKIAQNLTINGKDRKSGDGVPGIRTWHRLMVPKLQQRLCWMLILSFTISYHPSQIVPTMLLLPHSLSLSHTSRHAFKMTHPMLQQFLQRFINTIGHSLSLSLSLSITNNLPSTHTLSQTLHLSFPLFLEQNAHCFCKLHLHLTFSLCHRKVPSTRRRVEGSDVY